MALNIKTFVRTGGLYPGGATGLTILIQRIALQYFSLQLPYSVINLLLNAFPVYIGFRYIGKKFTLLRDDPADQFSDGSDSGTSDHL